MVGNDCGRFEVRMNTPERVDTYHDCLLGVGCRCVGRNILEMRRVAP